MSEKSVQEEEADAALVNKFRDELDDPKSSLLKKLTSSELTTGGTPERDAATAEILKEHGYENLSVSKLSELVNPRPKDVSQIQPPSQLVAPSNPAKPVLAFSHFAGQYKITSPYHPEGAYKMIVQAGPADKTKGVILWGQDSTRQQYEAKLMCSLKQHDSKETSECWAVWGDADGEHWNVQFFGPSETSSLASFVGFRRTKQHDDTKDDAVDAFHGSMTLLKGSSDASVIVPIITVGVVASMVAVAVFLCVRRIDRRRNEVNDPAATDPPHAERPLDEQRERENPEREMQERETREREKREREEREDAERKEIRQSLQDVVNKTKTEMTRIAASEVMKSSHQAKIDFVEKLDLRMRNALERAYNRPEPARPKYGQRLDDMTLSDIESARNHLISTYVLEVNGKVREVAGDARLGITANEVLTEIMSRLEAATVKSKNPTEYTDMLKEVIDRAHVSAQREGSQRAASDKREDGMKEFATKVGKLKLLHDLLSAQKNKEIDAAKEADPGQKRQREAEARKLGADYKQKLRELLKDKYIEEKKLGAQLGAHLETLKRQENEVRDYKLLEHEQTKSREEYRKRVERTFDRRGPH